MGMTGKSMDHAPMGDMNTTPLIDVMLVLLIMFIMAVPLATHSLHISLGGKSSPPTTPILSVNHVTLSAEGAIEWNGTGLSDSDLEGVLSQARKVVPEPLVLFEPDGGAAYGRSAQVLGVIKQSGLTGFGFVGNERYASFPKPAPKP